MKLYLLAFACYFFSILDAQTVFIKGVAKNYTLDFVPLYSENFKAAINDNEQVTLFPDKSYEARFKLYNPTIFSLFYKKVYIEPTDTVIFNFSFLSKVPGKYDHSINAIAKYPGNYLYYDQLEKILLNYPKLVKIDSTYLSEYFNVLKSFFIQARKPK